MAKPSSQVGIPEEPSAEKEPAPKRSWWLGRMVWIGGLSALVIGGVAWFYLSRFGSRSLMLPPMKVIRLTSFPGKETEPALSPDGKMVAFVWDGENGDNSDIYVMLVDGGTPLRLTTNPGDDFSPAWSPDGRFIAFRRDSSESSGIYLVPSLGGPERRLLRVARAAATSFREKSLAWSPDGKFLVVSEQSHPRVPHSLSSISIGNGQRKQAAYRSSYGNIIRRFFSCLLTGRR